MNIPTDQYRIDWNSTLRQEKYFDFHNFKLRNSGTLSGEVIRKLRERREVGWIYQDLTK